jgi:hypothetical protein
MMVFSGHEAHRTNSEVQVESLGDSDDVSQVNEALFNDLLDGRVTPAEAKKLQREIKPVIDSFRTTLRAAVLQDELRKRLSKYE